ncbi:unnamed protein product [Symbiodinium sp. CCMP2456]|nr:unnamed protein product [Symbiodinium sp. CCMP2456]
MQAESTEEVIQAFSERWLGCFPKPEIVIFDAAYSFASERMHEFLSSVNIMPHYVADKESWAHGVSEAAVQDVKRTAAAIHLDALEQHPFVTLQLTVSALNSTEYTAGYSAFQWAYGQNYSITDEDVRTFKEMDLVKIWRKLWPVTEVERFAYETSGQEDASKWRMKENFLNYHRDRKTTVTATPSTDPAPIMPQIPEDEEEDEPPTATKQQAETDVNQYNPGETKRAKVDTNWVELLHKEAAQEEKFDLYDAMEEAEVFLKVEFDLEPPTSNRQRKMLEGNPQAYLVKKMKAKEVDSFVKNEAVRNCLDDKEIREAYDTKRIVKARWVLTWKLVPPEDQDEARQDAVINKDTVHTKDGKRKAKARIVLLGFQHPNLLVPSFKTASPVQSSLGRNLLYTMAAQHQWSLEGLDLATAFLQTQPTAADEKLWTTGVQELRDALNVGDEAILRILRNMYGSTTAPRGLWLDLHKTLSKLRAEPVLGERCLWRWTSKERVDHSPHEHPLTIGAMGGHVDDFHRIGDDSEEWLRIKEAINNAYKWGTAKTGAYRHAGTDVQTVKDEYGFDRIYVSQDYYVETIQDVDIDPDRLRGDVGLT